jgi:hypothetical protein
VKKLITDRDVLDGSVSGRIVLDAGTLITPAARDRAARMGIEIVEAGAPAGGWHAIAPTAAAAAGCARCGGATCQGACATCSNASPGNCARCGNAACSCAGGRRLASGGHNAATLGGLADGLYLVRVQGGVASLLPATGPGLMRRAAGAG